MQDAQNEVWVTTFNGNTYSMLFVSDFTDYYRQFSDGTITFKQTVNEVHDRLIVLHYGTDVERVCNCEPTSKNARKKLAVIAESSEGDIKKAMHGVIAEMLGNQPSTQGSN